MQATTIYLANGLVRTVRGRAEEVGATLKRRTMTEDDRIRQFTDLDGETVTVNADAVALVEAAVTRTERTFGFSRVLEEAA
jgi:hypothetical protein